MVERETCLRVIIECKVKPSADFTIDIHLNLLVKVKDIIIARFERQTWVIDELVLKTKKQLGTSLQLQLNTARTKYFIGWTDIELHVRDVELLFVIVLDLADFLLPVAVH